tara:strand:+ start:1914 stop:6965 length:5052 start_codon:yes stop_codon:yes gene_type:complete
MSSYDNTPVDEPTSEPITDTPVTETPVTETPVTETQTSDNIAELVTYDYMTVYDSSCNNPPTYRNNGTTVFRPWARTQGQTCYNNCSGSGGVNCFTTDQLNMRRKAEVLKHNGNAVSSSFTKKQIYSMIAKGNYVGKKQYSSQTVSATSSVYDSRFTQVGNTLRMTTPCKVKNNGIASQSDVPGNKKFVIELDNNVPLTNYTVQRTYVGAQESWPETRWESTKKGFAVGKSGSAHPFIFSDFVIGNLYEGEYWTNQTVINFPFTFQSLLTQHICVVEGINISINGYTQPIISGRDLRDANDPSGNIIITNINNRDKLITAVRPGECSLRLEVTPNCKYSNIAIQLKQARNEERSNILKINPFIISTVNPNHNFLEINDALDNNIGNFIENEYWANRNSSVGVIVDVSGNISYNSNYFYDDGVTPITGSLLVAHPYKTNYVQFIDLPKKLYQNISVLFTDYAGNVSNENGNVIIYDFKYSNDIPMISFDNNIGTLKYDNKYYSSNEETQFLFDSDNSGNTVNFYNFGSVDTGMVFEKIYNEWVTMSELKHYFNFTDYISSVTSNNMLVDVGNYINNDEYVLIKNGFDVVNINYPDIVTIDDSISIDGTTSRNSYLSINKIDGSRNVELLGNNNLSLFMWVKFNNLSGNDTQYILNLNNETSITNTYNSNRFTFYAKKIDNNYCLQLDLFYKTYNSPSSLIVNNLNILTSLNTQLENFALSENTWYNLVITVTDYDYNNTTQNEYLRINVYINSELHGSLKIPNHTDYYYYNNINDYGPSDSNGNVLTSVDFNKAGFGLSTYLNNDIAEGNNVENLTGIGKTNISLSQLAFINETLNHNLTALLYNHGKNFNLKNIKTYVSNVFGNTQDVSSNEIIVNQNTGDIHEHHSYIYSNSVIRQSNPSGLNVKIKTINDDIYLFYTQKAKKFVVWKKLSTDTYFTIHSRQEFITISTNFHGDIGAADISDDTSYILIGNWSDVQQNIFGNLFLYKYDVIELDYKEIFNFSIPIDISPDYNYLKDIGYKCKLSGDGNHIITICNDVNNSDVNNLFVFKTNDNWNSTIGNTSFTNTSLTVYNYFKISLNFTPEIFEISSDGSQIIVVGKDTQVNPVETYLQFFYYENNDYISTQSDLKDIRTDFAKSIKLSNDGNVLVVISDDYIDIYTRENNIWSVIEKNSFFIGIPLIPELNTNISINNDGSEFIYNTTDISNNSVISFYKKYNTSYFKEYEHVINNLIINDTEKGHLDLHDNNYEDIFGDDDSNNDPDDIITNIFYAHSGLDMAYDLSGNKYIFCGSIHVGGGLLFTQENNSNYGFSSIQVNRNNINDSNNPIIQIQETYQESGQKIGENIFDIFLQKNNYYKDMYFNFLDYYGNVSHDISFNDIYVLDPSYNSTINIYEFNTPFVDSNKLSTIDTLGNTIDFYLLNLNEIDIMSNTLGTIKYQKELDSSVSNNPKYIDGYVQNPLSSTTSNNIINIGVNSKNTIVLNVSAFPDFLDSNGNIDESLFNQNIVQHIYEVGYIKLEGFASNLSLSNQVNIPPVIYDADNPKLELKDNTYSNKYYLKKNTIDKLPLELLSNRPGKINDIVINITIYVRLNTDQEAPYYLFSYQPNEFPLNSTVNKFQLIKNAAYTFILSEDIVDHPFYIGESWNNFSSSLNITSNGTGANNSLINQGETLNFLTVYLMMLKC